MAANKKPRKRYKPKPILWDTMAYVQQELTPVSKHDSYLLDLQLKNSQAMAALLHGTATKEDMDTLIAMSNITESLRLMGFGKEYLEVAVAGREALIRIAVRAVKVLRFVPTGPEIKALNELMELHDAQMEVITIQDMCNAIDRAKALIRKGQATKIPNNFLGTCK
ncbi:MAG TPA: hypothetical protein VLA31_02725 [Burkholderiaceae bacterium]|nr:hypothetical protein [Burkholderiaceae bacterium]